MSDPQLVDAVLTSSGVEFERVDERTWTVMLAGERKRTIPAMLRLDERSLHVRSLLCRDPDENHDEVYRYLLARNERSGELHFAVDDDQNIILVGSLPRVALSEDAVDRLLGAVALTADEVYNAVLRRGFADYIAHEQAWRAARSMPPNPISAGTHDDGHEDPTD